MYTQLPARIVSDGNFTLHAHIETRAVYTRVWLGTRRSIKVPFHGDARHSFSASRQVTWLKIKIPIRHFWSHNVFWRWKWTSSVIMKRYLNSEEESSRRHSDFASFIKIAWLREKEWQDVIPISDVPYSCFAHSTLECRECEWESERTPRYFYTYLLCSVFICGTFLLFL